MRKRIVLDLVGDFAIICSIVEVLLFCIYYFIPRSLPQIALSNYITQYYWIAALGSFLLILLYFCFWAWICFKRADVVRNGAGLSDAELFSHFKDGKKCCNYRVNGDFVFVNTSHGIFCMTKSDIHEHKMRRVHHTKRT